MPSGNNKYPAALPFRPEDYVQGKRSAGLSVDDTDLTDTWSPSSTVPYHCLTYGIPVEAAARSISAPPPVAKHRSATKAKGNRGDGNAKVKDHSTPKRKLSDGRVPDTLLLHPAFSQFNATEAEAGPAGTTPEEQPRRRKGRNSRTNQPNSLYDFLTVPVIGQVAALAGDRVQYRGTTGTSTVRHTTNRGARSSYRWMFAEVADGDDANREGLPNGGGGDDGGVMTLRPAGLGTRDPLTGRPRTHDGVPRWERLRDQPESERNYVLEQMYQDWGQNLQPRAPRVVLPEADVSSERTARKGSSSRNGSFKFLKVLSRKDSGDKAKTKEKATPNTILWETFRHDELCACGGFRQEVSLSPTANGSVDGMALVPFCLMRARSQQQQLRTTTSSRVDSSSQQFLSSSDFLDSRNPSNGCVCPCHGDSWFQTRQCTRCDCYRANCDQQ